MTRTYEKNSVDNFRQWWQLRSASTKLDVCNSYVGHAAYCYQANVYNVRLFVTICFEI